MTSAIDITKPVTGNPTTISVRENFAAARSEILALQNSVGFVDYQDTATAGAPISTGVSTWTKMTNNTLGANTKNKLPSDIPSLWNNVTNRLNFADVPLYSTLNMRADFLVTTTGANQIIRGRLRLAIGDPVEFSLEKTQVQFKAAGTYQFITDFSFYIGSTAVQTFPAEIQLWSDAAATVVVNGWYIQVHKNTSA